MLDRTTLADHWRFPWPIMDVLIGGRSSIDLPEMQVGSFEEATEFLCSYGYDPEDPSDQRKMHAVIVEAFAFVERQLLTPLEWQKGVRPPPELLQVDDPRQLLLWASERGPKVRYRRAWACAILRVMHTISHIEGVNRYADLESGREQIMGRFQRHIFRDEKMNLWLGTPDEKVRIDKIEWKDRKGRNSIILKLLHKKDNVAETIYDYFGVRIVTSRLCDVMMVVKFLRQFHMVTFPNCYPSRARNTLIDVPRFRTQIDTLRDMLTAGSISPENFESMVSRMTSTGSITMDPKAVPNPHSSSSYKSIQLTCRQMIKFKNPQLTWLERLKRELGDEALAGSSREILSELRNLVEGWHTVRDQRELRSFFPFEVQIMDGQTYGHVLSGDANHDLYKRSQIRSARRRVLFQVLELARQGARPE